MYGTGNIQVALPIPETELRELTCAAMRRTTAIALALRIVIALSTRTFFQPDEYFQSLEPAHHIVFGYGQLTWEWLMPRPIRSVVYPSLNIPIYWLLRVTGLDESWLLVGIHPPHHALAQQTHAQIALPRALHGALGAITDIWVGRLAHTVLGERYVFPAVSFERTRGG